MLSLLAFGGSASSPSSAADFVEMQLVLRCGRCSGARGCRCPAALACTCSPLTFALRCNCAAAYFEVDERHHPHRGRARGRLRGGMRGAFSSTPVSSRCRYCCCRWLPGGVELRGGRKGACVGAGALQLRSGSLGGLPARLRRPWRGRAARLLAASCLRRVWKKVLRVAAYFSGCVYVCACPVRVSGAPNSPLHEGMRGVARM